MKGLILIWEILFRMLVMVQVPKGLFVLLAVSLVQRVMKITNGMQPNIHDIYTAWQEGIIGNLPKGKLYPMAHELWKRARESSTNEHVGVTKGLCWNLGMQRGEGVPFREDCHRWEVMKQMLLSHMNESVDLAKISEGGDAVEEIVTWVLFFAPRIRTVSGQDEYLCYHSYLSLLMEVCQEELAVSEL